MVKVTFKENDQKAVSNFSADTTNRSYPFEKNAREESEKKFNELVEAANRKETF